MEDCFLESLSEILIIFFRNIWNLDFVLSVTMRVIIYLIFGIFLLSIPVANAGLSRPVEYVTAWVDGQLVRIGYTESSDSNANSLYIIKGLEGQYPVAEAKPGDADWANGFFKVYIVEFTDSGYLAHDFNKDGVADYNVTSWEMANYHMSQGHLRIISAKIRFLR